MSQARPRRTRRRERAKGRAFSTEEDDTLRKARGQPGWTWKEITSQLPGRSERATRDRWTRTLCEALQPRQLDRQQQPQTPKQRTVRFECDGCGKRLKAKVPAGAATFRTKCSDCGKWLEKVPQDLQAKIATQFAPCSGLCHTRFFLNYITGWLSSISPPGQTCGSSECLRRGRSPCGGAYAAAAATKAGGAAGATNA